MKDYTKKQKPLFKTDFQNQPMLIPPDLHDLTADNHLAQLVNKIVETTSEEIFIQDYPGGGALAYHPKILAKVIIYAYLTKVYSGREMAKLIKENIVFMWLAGLNTPDFRTINRFRSGRFEKIIKDLFRNVLGVCFELEIISLKDYFVDGTPMEANANRHKVVWKKRHENLQKGVDAHIDRLFKEIKEIVHIEEKEARKVERQAKVVSERLKSSEAEEMIRHAVKDLEVSFSKREEQKLKTRVKKLKEYEEKKEVYKFQETLFNDRNSFVKTDPDASGIRMKDGQVRAGYNVMIGTENQVVLNYSLHSRSSESRCFIDHMKGFESLSSRHCKNIVGDAAYGSEENYLFCKKKNLKSYLKYNSFHQETKRKTKKNQKPEFKYDSDSNTYTCPEGKVLNPKYTTHRKSGTNFKQKIVVYQTDDCYKCKNKCTYGKYRRIRRSERYEKLKSETKERLLSPSGIKLRSRRSVDVESVFGDFKKNSKFYRFNLRGLKKAETELGLLSLAHNLKKIIKKETDR